MYGSLFQSGAFLSPLKDSLISSMSLAMGEPLIGVILRVFLYKSTEYTRACVSVRVQKHVIARNFEP